MGHVKNIDKIGYLEADFKEDLSLIAKCILFYHIYLFIYAELQLIRLNPFDGILSYCILI